MNQPAVISGKGQDAPTATERGEREKRKELDTLCFSRPRDNVYPTRRAAALPFVSAGGRRGSACYLEVDT
jgi:hypothetical protein